MLDSRSYVAHTAGSSQVEAAGGRAGEETAAAADERRDGYTAEEAGKE